MTEIFCRTQHHGNHIQQLVCCELVGWTAFFLSEQLSELVVNFLLKLKTLCSDPNRTPSTTLTMLQQMSSHAQSNS